MKSTKYIYLHSSLSVCSLRNKEKLFQKASASLDKWSISSKYCSYLQTHFCFHFRIGEEDELIKPSKSRIPRPTEKLRKFQKLGQLLQSGDKGSKGDEPNPPSPQHVSTLPHTIQ